tara:strand:- start:236 stop:748 length:513 start_codon:yes stop_codon:yes gene_type:complete
MKKFFIVIIIFTFFFKFNAKAEIAYIDLNYILKSSEVGKFLNNYIKNIQLEYEQKYKSIEDDIINKEKLLIAQQNILNEEDFENKLKDLGNEVKKYRTEKQSSYESLKQFKIDNTKEILKILNPIITNFVNLNSISIVIPKKNIIVGKKNLDITDQIIMLLNNNVKKLNF